MPEMTILEVLKKIKHVDRKITKNKERVAKWCSYFDIEADEWKSPLYNTGKLLQSLEDLIILKGTYRHALHKANIDNKIEYKGKKLTIDEILVLRTNTLPSNMECLELLKRKEKSYSELRHLTEEERKAVKVVTQFDPLKRDKAIDSIEDEMANLDRLLDEINITIPTGIER